MRDIRRMLEHLPRSFRLVWDAAGIKTAFWLGLLIVQGLMPGATVYLTKMVLDGAQAALGQGMAWENVQQLVAPALLMGGVLLLTQILNSLAEWLQVAQTELVQDHVQRLIHEKTTSVDLALYDSSTYYDRLQRASSQSGGQSLELLNHLGALLKGGITLVTIALILVPYGVWLPLVLVFSAAPVLYVVLVHRRRHHAWWDRTTPDRRKLNYFNLLLTLDLTAAEMRLLDLGTYFANAYAEIRERLRDERLDLVKRQSLARLGAGFCSLAVTASVMGWMVWRALRGTASLGDLGLFYQAFNQGQGVLRTLMGSVGQVYASSLFLEHLFEFLDVRPTIESPRQPAPVPASLRQGIHFSKVSFRYPGASKPALRNFNMEIPAGKVTAIVGPNGAGKSTLLKLLCRFYDPESGSVDIDGTDLRRFSLDELRSRLTVMFQDPVRYQATAATNIAVGDLRADPSRKRLTKAAEDALIHETLRDLPDGYETQLGKYFGFGVELSGGQWQRVTLARAFFREAPIVVLDEPTSAMDAWAEHEWLQRFSRLVHGRTTLIITHRFTTAMHADCIHVMKDGDVLESGTHQDLLLQDGYYAESWHAQVETGWRSDAVDTEDVRRCVEVAP